jgi:hypothetical protein
VYVSYNCMPGWASELPVRRLLVELAAATPGGSSEKMRQAVQVLTRMNGSGFRYFDANPEAARAIESYRRVPPKYLAHEFLNETWQPFYSIDVIDEMADAGASLVGSATLADNHPMLLVDESAVNAMQGLSSLRQQHLALDFATNRRFRRDVFVRSDTPRSQSEAASALNAVVVGCAGDPQQLGTRVTVPRGQISFQPDFIEELQGLLSHGPVSLGNATAALSAKSRNVAEIVRNLAFLVAGGALMPFAKVFRHELPAEVRRPANPLVERCLACIIEQRSARAIPSELLGNGVLVKPLEALAIVELLSGAEPSAALSARLRGAATELELAGDAGEVVKHVAGTLLPNLARLKLVE